MTDFSKFISAVKESNRTLFAAEKIQLTPSSLESQLKKAFWAGFRHSEELREEKEKNFDPAAGLFDGIFGPKAKKPL